jgi:hypothetical protein
MAKAKSSSAITTLQLKPTDASEAIRHCVRAKMPLYIWGPPGIGKSQLCKQIADELGYDFVDIRLSQMDPTDLRGIPYPVTLDGGEQGMAWAPPSALPRNKDAKCIVLLDELNTAAPSIQAASYQLVLDRKLGDYILPEQCVVMAAGNRETDKGATFKMPTPLMNRFVHVEMRHDFDDWQTWALSRLIHRDVVGYLSFSKADLFDFDPVSASRGFPTPRTWEYVSRLLFDNPNLPEMVMMGLISGCVGDGVAVKFLEYRKNAAKLPRPADILSGKVTALETKEVSVCYSLTTGLCYELKEANDKAEASGSKDAREEWIKMSDRFLGFMMKNFQPEMVILGARTALANFQLPFDPTRMSSWSDFSARYEDLILRN